VTIENDVLAEFHATREYKARDAALAACGDAEEAYERAHDALKKTPEWKARKKAKKAQRKALDEYTRCGHAVYKTALWNDVERLFWLQIGKGGE